MVIHILYYDNDYYYYEFLPRAVVGDKILNGSRSDQQDSIQLLENYRHRKSLFNSTCNLLTADYHFMLLEGSGDVNIMFIIADST